jgi:hypothetical protein
LKRENNSNTKTVLFVARPTAGKTTLLTSNPQASQAAAAIGIVRSSAPFFIWVMECKSAMKRNDSF